jgi:4-hydroxybenzoyl-CoA thioesterase
MGSGIACPCSAGKITSVLTSVLKNRKNIRIEWGDCDPAGIIFFPRYFAYFDACTHALLERAGCRQRDMQSGYGILGFPLVDVRARFIIPTRYDDDVVVESGVAEFGRTSFQIQHLLYKDDVLAVEAFETRVCVALAGEEPGKMEARPIPSEVVRKLSEQRS